MYNNASIFSGGVNTVVNSGEIQDCTDEVLVEKIKEGDRESFRVIMERYQPKVMAVAFGIVHNQDDAKDIAQEAFLKIYRSIDKFRGDSKFYTWVYRITVNIAIDFMRKKTKKEKVQYNDALKADIPMPESKESSPRQRMVVNEMYQKLQEIINKLSYDQQTAFVLREMEDLSYQEIADIMKCSVGTVMSRLFYARQKVRDALKPYL